MSPLVFILLLIPSVVFSHSRLSAKSQWETWKNVYGKSYGTDEEEMYRRNKWMKNFRLVMRHNNRPGQTFKMEMNSFADQVVTRRQLPVLRRNQKLGDLYFDNKLSFAPTHFDWRTKGAVTPVRSQGQMGDAVSVAATECVESYNFIKNGKLVELSVQEVHDCCGSHFLTADIFNCIHNIGGLCSEADYPKHSDNKCHNASCTPVVQINGGKEVPEGNEDMLLQAVLQEPVMVGIDASHQSFELYTTGIYNEPNCSSSRVDHVVQVVGYGSQGSGKDYWIVKNSWGINWGMKGYVLMSRNKHNQCGIASSAIYPY